MSTERSLLCIAVSSLKDLQLDKTASLYGTASLTLVWTIEKGLIKDKRGIPTFHLRRDWAEIHMAHECDTTRVDFRTPVLSIEFSSGCHRTVFVGSALRTRPQAPSLASAWPNERTGSGTACTEPNRNRTRWGRVILPGF